jgi:hypothetical protein
VANRRHVFIVGIAVMNDCAVIFQPRLSAIIIPISAAVKAGDPPDLAYTSNVSISQMQLLGLVEDVSDVVDEAINKYGAVMKGINSEKLGKINGKWASILFIATPPVSSSAPTSSRKRESIQRPRRPSAADAMRPSPLPLQTALWLGPHPQPERRRLRLPGPSGAGIRRPLHTQIRHQGPVRG